MTVFSQRRRRDAGWLHLVVATLVLFMQIVAGPAAMPAGPAAPDVHAICRAAAAEESGPAPDSPAPVHAHACVLCTVCQPAATPALLAADAPAVPLPAIGRPDRPFLPPPATGPPAPRRTAARPRAPPASAV